MGCTLMYCDRAEQAGRLMAALLLENAAGEWEEREEGGEGRGRRGKREEREEGGVM